MRVRSYDDAAPDLPPDPEHSSLRFKRLCTVQLDRARELEISLVTGAQARSISLRLWRAKGKGRPQVPGQPLHLFPHQLDRVLTALTEAAAVLNADQEPPCSTVTHSSTAPTAATGPGDTSEPRPSETSPAGAA